jgi:hypothetical protein
LFSDSHDADPKVREVVVVAVSRLTGLGGGVALGVRGSEEHSRHGEDSAKRSLSLWQRPEVQAVLRAVGTRA